ncbi:MAG: hypothetical protein JWM95_4024 [Gemmatimonadetes bacterium]|nr:hypothetical protein [Gemmatimonadota bacterium]
MTAAPKPEADAPVKRMPKLTPEGEARLYEIKARNEMVRAIAGESWGAKLSMIQARAFAEYMRRFNLDISEIDNLGGRPYRNGRYYMRRVAELAAAERVEWYKGRHIGPDARLEEFAKAGEQWAIDERFDRLKECIRLGVPADAVYVYVVTVKMKELALPTEGVKWWSPQTAGSDKRKKSDPVADENPGLTVETRAWRRCGRLCAAEIPELREQEAEMEFAANETHAAMIEEATEVEITKPVAGLDDDAYAEPARQNAITEGPAKPIETDADIRRADAALVEREAAR